MVAMSVELRNIQGTEAAVGWAGGHTLVVDRPEGRAGGAGLGFNGGQLLALALGGCYCNDLRYAAHELGVDLGDLSVHVLLELDGQPLVCVSAELKVALSTLDGSDAGPVIERAKTISTVANSLRSGFPVAIRAS